MSACIGFSGYTGPAGIPCAVPCVMDQIAANLAPLVANHLLSAVYEGKARIPEGVDLDTALRAAPNEVVGYFAYDVKSREARTQTSVGNVVIQGLLQVHLDSDTSSTLHCAYQLAEMILAALNWEASFVDCSSRPLLITYTPTSDDVDDKVLQFEYLCTYQVPMTCAPMGF